MTVETDNPLPLGEGRVRDYNFGIESLLMKGTPNFSVDVFAQDHNT